MDEKATILKAFHYKLCPKCGTGIMRMYGCNHVRCSCGSHWCWNCQRPINACYASPCSEARDEGQDSEGDVGNIESEQDDADSAREITVSEIGIVVEPNPPATAAQAGPTNAVSERPSSEATAVVETTQAPTPNPSTEVEEVKQEEQTTQPQQPIVNLDNPDDPDYNWEGGDFDFGEEPSDEYWDVWGCMHRYRDFSAGQVPERWMVGLDREKSFGIECMACFKTVKIEGKKPVFEGPKTFEEWKAEIQEMDKAAAGGEIETEADVKAVKKEKRKSKKNGAFECKECGIIHCWNCKRAAIRRLTNYRKGAQ
jgi:hypothetical protein